MSKTAPRKLDVAGELKRCRAALTEKKLASAADALKLKKTTLEAFGIGSACGAWTFPMVDGGRKPLGVLLLTDTGKMGLVTGSEVGLLLPENYAVCEIPAELTNEKDDAAPLLFSVPGLSATLRLHDLGFRVAGRPTGFQSIEHFVRLLRSGAKQDVVVIAERGNPAAGDAYWKAIEAAMDAAETIGPSCGRVRFLKPPESAVDAAEWLSGCKSPDVFIALGGAKVANRHTLANWRKSLERRSTVRPKLGQNV